MIVFKSNVFNSVKLGKLVDINPPINLEKLDINDYISFIPMEAIDENYGEIKKTYKKLKKEIKGFTKFQEGDLLWAKISPCMQNGKSAIANNLQNSLGCGSTEFYILRPKSSDVLIEYIYVILRDKRILKNAENYFGGSAGQQRVSKDYLLSLPIPLPNITIQRQIVNIMADALEEKRRKEKQALCLLESISSYLLEELCITIPSEQENTLENRMFYVGSSKVFGGRFDPRKYTKKYQILFAAIENAPFNKKRLRDIIINDVSGVWGLDENNKSEDLVSCLTIRATEFDNKYNLNLDNNRTKFRKFKPAILEKISLSVDDILVEKSGGSDDQPVGRVAFIEQEMLEKQNLMYSNFIHKIIVNKSEADPRYVFEFLRLIHNIKITEVMQTQTNGIRNLIMKDFFSQLVILPDINMQRIIANEASNMRKKAKRLENEAEDIIKAAKIKVEKILLEGSL